MAIETATNITPTKDSLASFKARHNRWKTAPRAKLVAMPSSPLPSADQISKDLAETTISFSSPPSIKGIERQSRTTVNQKTMKEMTKEEDTYRSRLVEFYKKHNPEKLDTVDATLAKFEGREDELFRKLHAKYSNNTEGRKSVTSKFPVPSGEGPLCYLKFSVDGKDVGRVIVKLYEDKVPLASKNFKCLCTGEIKNSSRRLCYQGSKAHRIVPSFCVQMGDFTRGDGRGGQSIYPPNTPGVSDAWGKFKDEMFMQHSKPGLLSMANSGKNSNSSQVFFTLKPVAYLDGKHVVFGEVVEGMDVVEALGKVETNQKSQIPLKPVVVEDCGEIKDGKEVSCKVNMEESKETNKTGPFGFSSLSTTSNSSVGTTSPSKSISFGSNTNSAFTFGGTSTIGAGKSPFSFGSSKTTPTTSNTTTATSNTTTTTTTSTSNTSSTTATSKPSFGFGGTTTSSGPIASATPFSFGSTTATKNSNDNKTTQSTLFTSTTTSKSPFSFGSTAPSASSETTSFSFGGTTSSSSANSSSKSAFSFGTGSTSDKTPFSFGAPK